MSLCRSPRSQTSSVLRSATMDTSVPLRFTLSVAVRRRQGQKIEEHERYTEVHRFQHLTQADRIFVHSYLASVSSVDGMGAFLGEQVDHSRIDYFQSLERFREPGLPCELPSSVKESLNEDRRLQELEADVQKCSYKDPSRLKASKNNLASYRKKSRRDMLREYQEAWI